MNDSSRFDALSRSDLIDLIEEEGFQGVYFEPGDPISLANALAEVLDDAELRTRLGRKNFGAAAGIPMSEVVHWHLLHVGRLLGTVPGQPRLDRSRS